MSAAARRLDAVGAALVVALAAWILVAAIAAGSDPLPMLGTLLLAFGAVALARGTAVRGWPLGPAAVVALGAAGLLLAMGGTAGTAGGPLAYENASAAFYNLAAAGGVMMAFTWRSTSGRLVGAAAAVAFGALAATSGSRAGVVLLAALALGALLSWLGRVPVRLVTALAATATVAALIVTVVLATGGLDRGVRREIGGALSEKRVRLWVQALEDIRERPVTGVGPGGFGFATRAGRTDSDIQWAHSEFLQQGAETGLPGLALLVLLFLWGFARLWASPADPATGLAATALGLVGVHACLDYIVHFPAIALMAGLLLGTGQASRDREPDDARPGRLVRKALKAAVLPLGARARRRPGDVAILLYHRVGAGSREVDLGVRAFERQVAALASRGDVVTLEAALQDGGGTVLTIDDGYFDFHEHVLPVLARHRVPAVLYLATGLVVDEGGPRDGLTWDQLREAVAAGLVTVGSHTHDHANLGRASEAEAEEQLRRSKELIEDRLGVACRHFAYPWGIGSPDADRVVRRHFESAALPWGTNRAGQLDPYRLARLPILRSDGPVLFRAKVQGRLDREALLYRLVSRGPWRAR